MGSDEVQHRDERLVRRVFVADMLTGAERRRPVANVVVRELLATAAEQTTWEPKVVAFDRALAAVDRADEDERERRSS